MVLVFTDNGGSINTSLMRGTFHTGALELSLFLLKPGLNVATATVYILAILDGKDICLVLFRQDLPVLDRLNSGVVVIFMNFFVNDGDDFLSPLPLYSFLHNGRINLLLNSGVMVT